jgi:hypothetical protein
MNTDSLKETTKLCNSKACASACHPQKFYKPSPRLVLTIKTGNIGAEVKSDDAQDVRGRDLYNSLKPLEALYLPLFMSTFQDYAALMFIRLKLFSGYPPLAGPPYTKSK